MDINNLELIEIKPDNEEEVADNKPKFEPREPYRRSLRQWWTLLLYKIRYYPSPKYVSYCCHVCGESPDDNYPDSSTMLSMTNPTYNSYYSYEYGVTGYDWEEEHQCNNCGSLYGYSDSTC